MRDTGLLERIRWAIVAGASLGLAMLILLGVGLPQHRDFTGQYLEGYGFVAPEVGEVAPPFSGILLDGGYITLDALKNTPILLNFWATWCEPCRVEMPELMVFSEEHPEVRILAINTGESREIIKRWLIANDISLEIVMDVTGEIAQMYRLRGQPMSYLIGADGRISQIFFGMVDSVMLSQALTSLNE